MLIAMPRIHAYTGLLCLFTLLLQSACSEDKADKQHKLPPRTVKAATAEAKTVPYYFETLGRTTSLESVNIVSQVDGQIVGVHFTQGAMVKKGDLLFTIYQPPYEAMVTQARGKLMQSIAALEIAKLEVERNAPLVPQKLVSEQDFEQLEANVIELEGQVEENTGLLESAQVNLDYCTIEAPVDGMIGIYDVNLGNVVTAMSGETLTTIQQMDPIYIDFIAPTTQFPEVLKYYNEYGGKLVAEVSYLDKGGVTRDAELTILGNRVAENTGTVNLRATMENKDRAFWPNQPVSVKLILTHLEGAVVVPGGAIALGQQGPYAFVIKSDNTVEQRPVTVGQGQSGDTVVVSEGLKAGERVVIDGQVFLMPGEEVIVTNTKQVKLPKDMTDKVIALLKEHDKGSPELFKQIETSGQLPYKLIENLKAHGKLSAKEVAFIEQLEGLGGGDKGGTPAKPDQSKDAAK